MVVTQIYRYGAWEIRFRKKFNVDIIPNHSFMMYDSDTDSEDIIDFRPNTYKRVDISYDLVNNNWNVDITNRWFKNTSNETVDYAIDHHKHWGWDRLDNTNIADFKNLLNGTS